MSTRTPSRQVTKRWNLYSTNFSFYPPAPPPPKKKVFNNLYNYSDYSLVLCIRIEQICYILHALCHNSLPLHSYVTIYREVCDT